MNRYLLKFNKKGNLRFISHLDLQRLFQRAIKRGDIDVAYSHGFNPHELINIVQPLPLGFESLEELLEIDTMVPYDCMDLINRMNLSMPDGMNFYACEEIERPNQNSSCHTKTAEYEVSFDNMVIPEQVVIDAFLNQTEIIVLKRDKKTKMMVQKDVKSLVVSIVRNDNTLTLNVACAGNASLNPLNLLKSLFEFDQIEFSAEMCRIVRTKLVSE